MRQIIFIGTLNSRQNGLFDVFKDRYSIRGAFQILHHFWLYTDYGIKLSTVIGIRLKIMVYSIVDGKPFNKNCSRCVRYVCNINGAQLTQYNHTLKVIKFETSCAHTKLDLCFPFKLLNALIDCLVIMNFPARPRQIQLISPVSV